MRRIAVLVVALAVAATACGPSGAVDITDIPPLPETTAEEVRTLLATSERPVVLNIWASWCGPCRSEAPLLRRAHRRHGDEIRFVGVDVRDAQDEARAFLAEFDLDFEHYFDRPGEVQRELGGIGVPQTLFYAPGGDLVFHHNGVIDERTLALQIDELLRTG